MFTRILFLIFSCTFVYSQFSKASTVTSLKRYNVGENAVTLSGFSGGSSMATQFHVAHSSLFHGVALFSQAFYRCGPSSLTDFTEHCSAKKTLPYNYSTSVSDAVKYEKDNVIDSLQFLENQRVFQWIGELDEYISPQMGLDSEKFYSAFIHKNESISANIFRATHVFPTVDYGAACDQSGDNSFYLGKCNYSGAYHGLEFILRDVVQLSYPFNSTGGDNYTGQLFQFNQSEFYNGRNISEISMGEIGLLYVPQKCQMGNNTCLFHINFQGCSKSRLDIALPFIENSGFLPVADLNGIIILFPLTTETDKNWGGCWDFFSYTGTLFATREGEQIKVVKAMVDRVLGKDGTNWGNRLLPSNQYLTLTIGVILYFLFLFAI